VTATRPFELYLMSLMRGEQAIAAALASIEVTPDAYRTTAKWMAESIGFDRVGHGIELYRRTLGEPLETTAEQGLEPGSGFARSLRQFRMSSGETPTGCAKL